MVTQKVLFLQLNWEKQLGKHNLKSGISYKSNFYDDNTPGTANLLGENQPMKSPITGIYVEDEWEINDKNTLLIGYRYDYHKFHKSVHSPRLVEI
jgi:outer membrane receptor for ferrienterochelin and colicins